MREPSPLDRVNTDRDVLVPLLLVAFVIVVTALVATVVLDMGQSPGSGDVARASVEFDADDDTIRVAFTSTTRPGARLDVEVVGDGDDRETASATLVAVGDTVAFDGLEDGRGYRVVVVAEWRDQRSVVTTRSGRL